LTVIHFSDTHLGFNELDIVNEDGINQREADFYKAFEYVIDAILEIKPNYVIHTGDLFHRANPSNRAINVALSQLKRLEEANIPFIIIAGNHSTPRITSTSSILQSLQTLDNVYAIFQQQYEKVIFDDVVFHGLPHINNEQIIDSELDKIESNIDFAKKNILLMHSSVGAYYLMNEFGEWVFPKEREYIFSKMDYVALGHWHGFGAVGKYPNVYYAGSTERTSSSDKRENKGYILLELDNSLKVTHHTIPLRKSLEFTIDANNFNDELQNLNLSDIDGALVEVKLYNLNASTFIDITNQEIYKIFQGALHIRIKREFQTVEGRQIEENIEANSLEEHFLSYITEVVDDREEEERLSRKAKELFANYEEEVGDDSN